MRKATLSECQRVYDRREPPENYEDENGLTEKQKRRMAREQQALDDYELDLGFWE